MFGSDASRGPEMKRMPSDSFNSVAPPNANRAMFAHYYLLAE